MNHSHEKRSTRIIKKTGHDVILKKNLRNRKQKRKAYVI
jgi:hypothetical protein